MNLFSQIPNHENKQIEKIKKCISEKNTPFDLLRKKMILELKKPIKKTP